MPVGFSKYVSAKLSLLARLFMCRTNSSRPFLLPKLYPMDNFPRPPKQSLFWSSMPEEAFYERLFEREESLSQGPRPLPPGPRQSGPKLDYLVAEQTLKKSCRREQI